MDTKQKPPKVFISYAHTTESFADKILDFSNMLRTEEYIDANIDQYEENPPQGWPRWMEEQIRLSDFVLIVCTSAYLEKVNSYSTQQGKGVNWEVSMIYQSLYQGCCNNSKFIPILFDGSSENDILLPLQGSTFYHVENPKELKKLCNRLKGIPNTVKPALGSKHSDTFITQPALDAKSRKTLFATSFIDIDEWNKAKWCGTGYLFPQNPVLNIPSAPPILLFVYKNADAAINIFADWKKHLDGKPFDDLSLSIITDATGYYVFVTTSIDYCTKKADELNLDKTETLYMVTSRFHHMKLNPYNNNLVMFKHLYSKFSSYYIAPCYLENPSLECTVDNLHVIEELAIKMTKINFKDISDIGPNDLECAILHQPLTD